MKLYGQLIKARLEQLSGVVSSIAKGLIHYNTDSDKPFIDTGTGVGEGIKEIMVRESLGGEASGPYVIANPILAKEGGTGKTSAQLASGNAGDVLQLNSSKNGYDLVTLTDQRGVDAIDTKTNLDALPRSQGKLYYASDENELYTDDGAILNIAGGETTLPVEYWQKTLSANLNADGVIGDLEVTGLIVGEKYRVILSAHAVREATSSNEIQQLTFSEAPTYGTFRITFDGQTTESIGYDYTAGEIQTEMELLSNMSIGDVIVSGDFITGFTFSFAGTRANTDLPEIVIFSSSLVTGESGGVNEIQDIIFSAIPTGGTFSITFDGQTTSEIQYNATSIDVKSAVEALSNINGATVTQLASGWRIEFDGSLVERSNIAQLTSSGTLISNGPITSAWPSPKFPFTLSNVGAQGFNSIIEPPISSIPDDYKLIPIVSGTLVGNTSFLSGNSGAGGGFIAISAIQASASTCTWSISLNTVSAGGFIKVFQAARRGDQFGANLYKRCPKDANGTGDILITSQNFATGSASFGGTFNILAGRFAYIYLYLPSATQYQVNDIALSFSQTAPVVIAYSTSTQGVTPSGGIASVASPSTLTDGTQGIAGPAKIFGAKCLHNGSVISRSKYLPPAQSSEDSSSLIQTETFITASAGNITVESEGLGGSETLSSMETKLTVIKYDQVVENL